MALIDATTATQKHRSLHIAIESTPSIHHWQGAIYNPLHLVARNFLRRLV